jgi:hypothetical protein
MSTRSLEQYRRAQRVPVQSSVSVLSDISLLSDGLGQCRQVPPNLSERRDTIWRLLFQKRNTTAEQGFFCVFWNVEILAP